MTKRQKEFLEAIKEKSLETGGPVWVNTVRGYRGGATYFMVGTLIREGHLRLVPGQSHWVEIV